MEVLARVIDRVRVQVVQVVAQDQITITDRRGVLLPLLPQVTGQVLLLPVQNIDRMVVDQVV